MCHPQGLLGLCVGAHVTLVIPPEMGYGDAGHPSNDAVPGGATLRYEMEILTSVPGPPEQVRRQTEPCSRLQRSAAMR